ncbi:helicase/primase [Murid herpesvirus 3]|uniref:Helicase/primase n=2 Tax=Murid betaherpesvirus 3 TaxID=2560603 RepID=A0A1P8VIV5_9BETA|nr:helicase/primase [Murine roseolovirus]APZ76272.1 helicase/primase [Murid betaherpesvirus 3]AYH64715.1 helicase/primase [Murid herpesvirus 3]
MTQVLFATDNDCANIIVRLLSKLSTGHYIFPIMIKYAPSNNVFFCLQTQKCFNSQRIDTVFVCNNEILNISSYMNTCTPIPTDKIIESIIDEKTEELYKHLFKPTNNNQIEFKYMIYFNRTNIIKYLTNKYLMPTSPFWFLATYGQTEGLLLLTMYYYLFEKQKSTIQTTKHYVNCFTEYTGDTIFIYSSMLEFMKIMVKSKFRSKISTFVQYAKQKNQRDLEELQYVDTQINQFRNHIHFTNTLSVNYIYIAYNTAFEKHRFLKYSKLTEYDPNVEIDQQCKKNPLMIGNCLQDDLLQAMHKYFNINTYFDTYVKIKTYKGTLNICSYVYNNDKNQIKFFTSDELAKEIAKINEHCEGIFSPLPTTLQSLLKLSASNRIATIHGQHLTRRNYLFKQANGPFPVFRIETAYNKNYYTAALKENWLKNMEFEKVLQFLPTLYTTDENISNMIWLKESSIASSDPQSQFYFTRHEIFNGFLPVRNFIIDIDFDIHTKIFISSKFFFDICRKMRKIFLDIWSKMFNDIDKSNYPIYFFKTKCDTDTHCLDPSSYNEMPFCTCTKKIGLRVIIPLPEYTCIIGSECLKQLAKICNHIMCLDTELMAQLNKFTTPNDSFDTGIYSCGKSIRMAYMYKIDKMSNQLYGRLIPIVIIPDGYKQNPVEFVKMQFNINNLLHHGMKNKSIQNVIYSILDKGCSDNKSFMDTKSKLIYNKKFFSIETLMTQYLLEYNLQPSLLTPEEKTLTFIRNIVWPILKEQIIKTFPSRVSTQFENITFINVDNKNIQIKRFTFGKMCNFQCIARQHKGNRDNVNVYLQIKPEGNKLVIILWSTCFTTKCNSNSKQVHSSISMKKLKL